MRKKENKKRKQKKKTIKIKDNVRYDSLNPAKAPRVRKELLDADYLDKLSPEEYKWYAQFTDEWSAGAVHKTKSGKVKSGYLHNTKELAKSVYDNNNRRNNDVLGVSKANNLLRHIDMTTTEEDDLSEVSNIHNPELTEMAVISQIEYKNKIKDLSNKETLTEEEQNEVILTKTEYLRLVRSGAKIPDKMKTFYKNYYKLD